MGDQVREEMEVDILFVGAGIANLSAAYSLMNQIEMFNEKAITNNEKTIEEPVILVIDKGEKPGNHALSGAVVDPRAFHELFPEIDTTDLPFTTPVKEDKVCFLTTSKEINVPHKLLPAERRSNEGCYLASLSEMTAWLAEKCEEVGVEVYTEFAAAETLYNGDTVIGVRLGDTGLTHGGKKGGGLHTRHGCVCQSNCTWRRKLRKPKPATHQKAPP